MKTETTTATTGKYKKVYVKDKYSDFETFYKYVKLCYPNILKYNKKTKLKKFYYLLGTTIGDLLTEYVNGVYIPNFGYLCLVLNAKEYKYKFDRYRFFRMKNRGYRIKYYCLQDNSLLHSYQMPYTCSRLFVRKADTMIKMGKRYKIKLSQMRSINKDKYWNLKCQTRRVIKLRKAGFI